MALQSVSSSTSVVLSQKEEIPSAKKMLRTTSQSFKRSSSLLQEAIQVHEKKEKELLSTIQSLSEENQKLRAALETSEGAHQQELLIERKKIRELKSGIENVASQFKTNFEDIGKICQKLFRRPEQYRLCLSGLMAYQHSKRDNWCTYSSSGLRPSAHAEFMKAKLDDEYKERVYLQHGLMLFDQDTENDAKTIERKLEMVSKEFKALEETSKNMPQE